jgi:hypothetical protein
VDVELEPEQLEEVVRTVEQLLEPAAAPIDPWWQAGLAESLQEHA